MREEALGERKRECRLWRTQKAERPKKRKKSKKKKKKEAVWEPMWEEEKRKCVWEDESIENLWIFSEEKLSLFLGTVVYGCYNLQLRRIHTKY